MQNANTKLTCKCAVTRLQPLKRPLPLHVVIANVFSSGDVSKSEKGAAAGLRANGPARILRTRVG
jgi:hypothetical protein